VCDHLAGVACDERCRKKNNINRKLYECVDEVGGRRGPIDKQLKDALSNQKVSPAEKARPIAYECAFLADG
jgi:hypothetical protein